MFQFLVFTTHIMSMLATEMNEMTERLDGNE